MREKIMMNMNKALEILAEKMKEDYLTFSTRNGREELNDIRQRMYNAYCDGIEFQEGRKYIKVITENSVWGFIMKADDKKFKAGDILKAAGYNAPARNAARGNIFDDNYTIRWTGPLYL